ncbi:hypothetical protein COOONC_19635, partial [Cooperia oncophora]
LYFSVFHPVLEITIVRSEVLITECSKLVDANRERNSGLWSASVPIKIRSTLRTGNNDLPMKGIPNQNPCKLNSGFTYEPKKFQRQLSKREGGAKLLDICELPQSLKKRRQMELIEERKRKQEEKEMAKKKALEDKGKRAAQQKMQENAKKQNEKKSRSESVRNQETGDGSDQVTDTSTSAAAEESSQKRPCLQQAILKKWKRNSRKWSRSTSCGILPENPYMSRESIHRMPQRDQPQQSHQQHLLHQHPSLSSVANGITISVC